MYVGRSRGSPTGPFLDRDGNDMAKRREVQLGGTRMIRVLSAKWGANCRADGRGFFERDVLLAAQRACNERTACDWTLRYQELDELDRVSGIGGTDTPDKSFLIMLTRRKPHITLTLGQQHCWI